MSAAFKDQLVNDSFECALAVDGVTAAFERRLAGKRVHAPIDARLLASIAGSFDLASLDPDLPLYERVLEIERMIKTLPTKHRSELIDSLVEDRKRVPWRAMRGPQSLSLELALECDVLLLAGGAASGKTEVALAIMMLQSRNARFLRKTSLEFQAAMKRIGEIVGSTDGRNLANQSWTLPPPYGFGGRGVALEFSSMNDPDSHLRMQGRAVDTLVVDDVGSGQVSRDDIQFVSRWLRSAEDIPKKLILPSNPPTSNDSLWLRDEWFRCWLSPHYEGTPAVSGEIRYFLPRADEDGNIEVEPGTPGAQKRAVVLSTVTDNPRLMRTGYDKHLAQTPTAVLRRRLLKNDWAAGFDCDDPTQVIPTMWIESAMDRWQPREIPSAPMAALGVDVARGGRDRTLIARRHVDLWFDEPLVYPGTRTPDGPTTASLVIAARRNRAPVFIDVVGVGSSPYDFLVQAGIVAIPVTAGSRALGADKSGALSFANRRSELFWRMRELLDPQAANGVALPPDDELLKDLSAPRFQIRGARIYVEGRDDIIKRIGRSPDYATAYCLASIDVGRVVGQEEDEQTNVLESYDPYANLDQAYDPCALWNSRLPLQF